MGGYGSGRRWTFSKKATVEDAHSLSIFKLSRDGLLKPGSYNITWKNTRTGEAVGSISYILHTGSEAAPVGHLQMTLKYAIGKEKEPVEEPIQLVSTRPNFGGIRHWFTCPLVTDGQPCNRRAGTLHLVPGCKYFGCRQCLNLTYTSRQTHEKKWDYLLRLKKGSPFDFDEALERLL